MDRSTAVTRVQRDLGFKTTLSTEIVDALKDSQSELEKDNFLPWFLQSEVTSAATVDGEERVALPTGFLREWTDDGLWYYDGTAAVDERWTLLVKDDIEFLRGLYPGEGKPVAYALDPSYFRIFPTPDEAYTLKMIFYKADTVLSSDVENKWLEHAHELMIGEAGMKIAGPVRDEPAMEIFQSMSNRGRARLIKATEARMEEQRRYVMGGED